MIDEYARPIENRDDQSMLLATEGDMEMSPPAPEMAPMPNFSAFPNVMGKYYDCIKSGVEVTDRFSVFFSIFSVC